MLVRQNRNLYAIVLLDQILSKCTITEMFLKAPPRYLVELPILNSEEVIAGLSRRFHQAMQGQVSQSMEAIPQKQTPKPEEKPRPASRSNLGERHHPSFGSGSQLINAASRNMEKTLILKSDRQTATFANKGSP